MSTAMAAATGGKATRLSLQELLAGRVAGSTGNELAQSIQEPEEPGDMSNPNLTVNDNDRHDNDMEPVVNATTLYKNLGSRTSSFRDEDEQEMPSSSYSVMADEADLLQLLAGETTTPIGPFSPDGNNQQTAPSRLSQNELIELYSAIAFLKKENHNLAKDLEFTKKSKDAIMMEAQNKHSVETSKLKNELKDANMRIIQYEKDLSSFKRAAETIEGLKNEVTVLTREKEALESMLGRNKDDQGNVRGELMATKADLNKARMELARAKSEADQYEAEAKNLRELVQSMEKDISTNNANKDEALRASQIELRNLDDMVAAMKSDIQDKAQLINRMNNDLLSLDRNLTAAINENTALRQRSSALDAAEKELSQLKTRVLMIERENRDLMAEVGALRNQLQTLGGNGTGNNKQYQALQSNSSLPANPRPPSFAPPNPFTSHDVYKQSPSTLSPYPAVGGGAVSERDNRDSGRFSIDTNVSYQSNPPSSGRGTYTSYQPQSLDSTETQRSYNNREFDVSPPSEPLSTRFSRSAPKSLSAALGPEVNDIRSRSSLIPTNSSSKGRESVNLSKANDSSSLANLIQGKKLVGDILEENSRLAKMNRPLPSSDPSPFATERTATEIMSAWEIMEKELTTLMTEKSSLQDESEK